MLRLHWFVLLYMFRKVYTFLIAIRIERLLLKKYSSLLPLVVFLLFLLLGFVPHCSVPPPGDHACSLVHFSPIAITARISQSRALGLSCFPRHPDLLQLLCLVGQCYNCNLLIVEVIVNRMCFLLCCCCRFCFCSSSSSLSVCTPTRAFWLLLGCCRCWLGC